MLGYLLLLFILVPALEILVLLQASEAIGLLPTFGVVILTGVAGAYLARQQGLGVLRRINADMREGRAPTGRLLDAAMILIGGVLLLTPGFLTDALGFLLLLPPTRAVFKRLARRWLERQIESGYIVMEPYP